MKLNRQPVDFAAFLYFSYVCNFCAWFFFFVASEQSALVYVVPLNHQNSVRIPNNDLGELPRARACCRSTVAKLGMSIRFGDGILIVKPKSELERICIVYQVAIMGPQLILR